MRASLRRAIDGGDYRVDPDAVAEAILRRARRFGQPPDAPSVVLVPADLFEDRPRGPGQLDALALDHGP